MEEKEYNDRLKQIEDIYKKSKNDLYIECAKSLRKYKIGDIIKKNDTTIIVEKFGYDKFYNMPYPVYHGTILKKDLTPRKDGAQGSIWNNDKVELIKEVNNGNI